MAPILEYLHAAVYIATVVLAGAWWARARTWPHLGLFLGYAAATLAYLLVSLGKFEFTLGVEHFYAFYVWTMRTNTSGNVLALFSFFWIVLADTEEP